MENNEPQLYGIKDATDCIDGLSFDQLDILNEYLNDEHFALSYITESEDNTNPEENTFFPVLAGYLNSLHWGRESIKHYIMYRSRFFLSEQEMKKHKEKQQKNR
ncbi:hypothetical protein QM201_25920 [Enterobacter asburiae]|nr:hypothetical protein [Enterobacter asburiae]